MGALYFHLSAGFEFLPYMPTDFTVAHHNELLEATLSWTNPAVNMVGNPLTELLGIHIYRDGEFVIAGKVFGMLDIKSVQTVSN